MASSFAGPACATRARRLPRDRWMFLLSATDVSLAIACGYGRGRGGRARRADQPAVPGPVRRLAADSRSAAIALRRRTASGVPRRDKRADPRRAEARSE